MFYSLRNERGVALLMTIFVVSLATILVIDMGYRLRFDARSSRAFTEGVQAEYIVKSGLNLGRALLELPKLDGIKEDWLGEPWALIASAPSLPISGFVGEPRLAIVDEEGKIDLNAILDNSAAGQQTGFAGFAAAPQGGNSEASLFWKHTLRNLFDRQGFVREQYPPEQYRTPGNIAYDAADQVAVLQDWIDTDTLPYSSASFPGDGAESDQFRNLFYNRPLRNLMELPVVPGMVLERVRRIAPYVRVSPTPPGVARQINVNTAPIEVLLALGFMESQAVELAQQRLNLPITREILETLVAGDPELKRYTKVSSTEFSIYSRVVMPNVTRWLRAVVNVQGQQKRRTIIRSLEIH